MTRKRDIYILFAVLALAATTANGQQQLLLKCPGLTPEQCVNFLLQIVHDQCTKNPAACIDSSIEISDHDECSVRVGAANGHDCDLSFAHCVNTDRGRGFHCVCNDGYADANPNNETISGTVCNDIDECDPQPGPCAPDHATCTNEPGSYSCACNQGFAGNASVECADVNECDDKPCPDGCTNIVGSYLCDCSNGYEYNSTTNTCDNINECLGSPCVSPYECVDTQGSFECQCPDDETCVEVSCADATDCSTGAICTNVTNGYACNCPKGFEGDPRNSACTDIDECENGNNNCGAGADCENIDGSFVCKCSAGFTGDGFDCDDINECLSDSPPECTDNKECVNSRGTVSCECIQGYQLGTDGVTCEDIDECSGDNAVYCGENGECVNNNGSYTCVCNEGYAGEPCLDVDECLNDPCPANTQCRDNQGSFTCACDIGYSGDNCTDIDECVGDNAFDCKNGICNNLPGTVGCDCNEGYTGVPCENINECVNNPCGSLANCVDTTGSYECNCIDGYSGDGITCEAVTPACSENEYLSETNECLCIDGFSGDPCENVNECDRDPCDANANCTDTDGSYQCACKEGYNGAGKGPNSCEDIDECENADGTLTSICGEFGACTNSIGSYSCECNEGFDGSPCENIIECDDPTTCNGLADCRDTIGSFVCTCQSGYTGHGFEDGDGADGCSDINECDATHSCNETIASCVNKPGSYVCECKEGLLDQNPAKPGTVCEDIDECEASSHNCSETIAKCVNNIGSFSCECKEGLLDKNPAQPGTVCEEPSCDPTCHENAECVFFGTTSDSSGCQCNDGFSGNGINCTELDKCPDLSGSLENGVVNTEDGIFVGDTATFTCNDGYFLTGDKKRTCESSLEWSGTAPTCTRGCEGPTIQNNGFANIELATGYAVGTVVTYECRTGYELTDSGADLDVTCQIDFTWSAVMFKCEKKNCGHPGDIENGRVEGEDFTFGNYITYVCDPGYTRNGVETRSCQATGRWEPDDVPTCNPVTCPTPPELENGSVDDSFAPDREFNDRISFSCNIGYKLDGPNEATCNELGNWDPVPTCVVDLDCDFEEFSQSTCGYTVVSGTFARQSETAKSGFPGFSLVGNGVLRHSIAYPLHGNEEACISVDYKSPEADVLEARASYENTTVTLWTADQSSSWATSVFRLKKIKPTDTEVFLEFAATSDVVVDNIKQVENSECGPTGPTCNDTCHKDAECVFLDTSTETTGCRCKEGFGGDGVKNCIDSGCEGNETLVNCFAEPCSITTCASDPTAECRNNYCGGCYAEFYKNDIKIDCDVPPSRCPEASNDTVGVCVEECSSSSDCPSGQICCSNGCGHVCVNDPDAEPTCDICHEFADCQILESFPVQIRCTCKEGYSGDGKESCEFIGTTVLPPPPPMITPPPPEEDEEDIIEMLPPPPMIPPPFFLEGEDDDTVVLPGLPPMFPPPPPFDTEETQTAVDPGPPPMFPPPPFIDVEETDNAAVPGPPPMFPPPPPFTAEEMEKGNVAPPPPMFTLPPPFFVKEERGKASPPPALVPPPFPLFLFGRERRAAPPLPMMPPPPPYSVYKKDRKIAPPFPPFIPPPPYSSEEKKKKIAPPPPPMIIPPPSVEEPTNAPPLPPPLILPPPMPELNQTDNTTCPDGYIAMNTSCIVTCVDIDECSTEEHDCDLDTEVCKNTDGSFECKCQDGHEDVDGICTDPTACRDYNCHENAECIPSKDGAMECKCPDGVFGDGVTWCRDFDECADDDASVSNGSITWLMLGIKSAECGVTCLPEYNSTVTTIEVPSCHPDARCTNKFAGFDCDCNAGFIGNGQTCERIVSCETIDCPEFSTCSEEEGSVTCICAKGLELDVNLNKCVDLDECELKTAICRSEEKCNNTFGGYDCICKDGYERVNPTDSCQLIDSCASAECIPNSECVNELGGYTCVCKEKYILVDDECERAFPCAINPCSVDATCAFAGTTICTCNEGFTGDGETCIALTGCDLKPCHADAICNEESGTVTCVCQTGYSGDGINNCDFNECLSDPCPENSECEDLVDAFECKCLEGFTGPDCIAIDPCDKLSCPEFSTCVIQISAAICKCQEGLTLDPDLLECLDIDECALSTTTCSSEEKCNNTFGGHNCICKNGYERVNLTDSCQLIDSCASVECIPNSECVNVVGGHICECDDGYTLVEGDCEKAFPCGTNPCSINATCVFAGTTICTCNEGFTGDGETCTKIPGCENDPCHANASCDDASGTVVCVCKDGYTGDGFTCDFDVCSTNPCPQNSVCEYLADSFECKCLDGFTGPDCTKITPCNPDPCSPNSNGCTIDGTNFTCDCKSGFEQQTTGCEDIDECETGEGECQPNAGCKNTIGNYICECDDGYTLVDGVCEKELPCATNTCSVSASCAVVRGAIICTCNEGFTGDGFTCTTIPKCESGSCHTNANCDDTSGTIVCVCQDGFTGDGITCTVDNCSSDPCPENSVCENLVGSFNCRCLDDFTGPDCTKITPCNPDPCDPNSNGCTIDGTNFICDCKSGFEQRTTGCEDIDECETGEGECPPNAGCKNMIGSFICECDDGYTLVDENCIRSFPCAVSPCSDDATCAFAGTTVCTCNEGFIGDGFTCTEINECDSNPCHSNADCVDQTGSYTCTCQAGFTGDGLNCEVDECSSDPCPLNSVCEDLVGSFNCRCLEGFTGADCVEITLCFPDPCGPNSFGCTTEGVDYFCDCHDGYEFNEENCQNINECNNPEQCPASFTCLDNDGSYTCVCGDGLIEKDGVCQDVDECDLGTHECGDSICTNIDGGYTCSCHCGYFDAGSEVVMPGTDCALNQCLGNNNCSHSCVPNRDGYTCVCDDGFELNADGETCEPITSCDDGICTNGVCFEILFEQQCRCLDGFIPLSTDPRRCLPTSTCGLVNGCSDTCSLVDGKEECSCDAGYVLSEVTPTCCVIEECTSTTCNGHGSCKTDNETGIISCDCNVGYQGDRCTEEISCTHDPCGPGVCTDLEGGGYTCNCWYDGFKFTDTCVDINECEEEDVCKEFGQACINFDNGYRCECGEGFRLPDDSDEPQDGSVCYETTLFPFGIDSDVIIRVVGVSEEVLHRSQFQTDVAFQDKTYSRYYVLNNGAIVLERGLATEDRVYRLSSGSSALEALPNGNEIDHVLIAPFLGDFDFRVTRSRVYVDEYFWYSATPEVDDAKLSEISTLLNDYFSMTDFYATEVVIVTWEKLATRVTFQADRSEKDDTFQLVLASDGMQSYVIYNYRIGSMDGRHNIRIQAEPLIGFSSTDGFTFTQSLDNPRRPDLSTNIEKQGRFAYQLHNTVDTTEVSPETHCMNWYREQPELLASPICPATIMQLVFDFTRYTNLLYQPSLVFRKPEAEMAPYFEADFLQRLSDFTSDLCFQTIEAAADGSGTICCYAGYPSGALLDGGYSPNAEVMGGQVVRYLITDPMNQTTAMNFYNEDVKARNKCCQDEGLCNLYKSKRPSTSSQANPVPQINVRNTVGDPTIGTLDGNSYSFSGLGEYSLVTGEDMDIQGRFVQQTDVDGKPIEGTILRVLAFKSTGTPTIEFKFANGGDSDIQNITVTVDGTRITSGNIATLASGGTLTYSGGVEIKTILGQAGLRAFFANSVVVTALAGQKILTASIGIPVSLKGQLKGLYGLYDGNSTNDFQLRDGTELDLASIKFTPFNNTLTTTKETRMNEFLPSGTILESEVFDFGQSWLVPNASESLFTYLEGESWESMRNTSFMPMFLPALLEQATEEQIAKARELCIDEGKRSLTCLRTLLLTKDENQANQVLAVVEDLELEIQALINLPPTWNTTLTEIEMQVGESFTLNVVAEDDDVVTYSLEGSITAAGATLNPTTGFFTWTPANDTSVSLIFVATDASGLQRKMGVKIKLCTCENGGSCNYEQSEAASGDANNFQIYGCNCTEAWSGTQCQSDKDECVTNPCDAGECIDAEAPLTGYTCNFTGCPAGKVLLEGICWTVDACENPDLNVCNDTCIPLGNSEIACECGTGLVLKADNVSCDDINECDTMCQAPNTKCENTHGNYSCSCKPGYTGDNPLLLGCLDENECTEGIHNCDTISENCNNLLGNFSCVCKPGFTKTDGSCIDDDECELKSDSCNRDTEVCKNEPGTYRCECASAFTSEGDTCVYDCTKNLHNCPTDAFCSRSGTSFSCICPSGFIYNSTTNECDDDNECLANDGKGPCGTTCTNNKGSYSCSCDDGFILDSDMKSCSDINECDNTATCEQNCTNLPGSHSCSCYDGFDLTADGCSATDPCTVNITLDCVNAECFRNSADMAECACKPGFQTLNETHCVDVRECDTEGKCGSNTICNELDGSFSCQCEQYYADISDSDDPTVVSCVVVRPLTFTGDATTGINSVSISWLSLANTDEVRVTIEKSDGSGTPITETVTSTSKNFTGLDHDMTYNFTFVNVFKGVDSISKIEQFTTDILLLPPTLEALDVALVTSSSISVSYTKPTEGYCDDVKFYYTPTGSGTTESTTTATGSPVAIGPLDSITSYTIEAVCIHETTESERTTSITQFTRPNSPVNVRRVDNPDLPYGSIQIEWDAPTQVPATYEADVPSGITFTPDATIPTKGIISNITPGEEFTITVFSLNEGLRSGTGQAFTATVPITTTAETPTTATTSSSTTSSTTTTTIVETPTTPTTVASTTTTAEPTTGTVIVEPAPTTDGTPEIVDTTNVIIETTIADDTPTSASTTPSSTTTTTEATTPATETEISSAQPATSADELTTTPTTTSTTGSTTRTTTPSTGPCGALELFVENQCTAFITRRVSMRITSITFTEDLTNENSEAYQLTVILFTSVFDPILGAVSVSYFRIRLTFRRGSVIADGEIDMEDTNEDTATFNRKINEVLNAGNLSIPGNHTITSLTFSNFNECSNAALYTNCHVNASCTDSDPGFTCKCVGGYRDKNETNPGTICEPQCEYDGSSYCLNGGTCEENYDNEKPTCSCTTFYQGDRCADTNSGAVAGVVLGVLGGVLLIVIVVVLILYCKKKQAGKQNLTSDDATRKRYDEIDEGSTTGSFRYKERNLDDMLA